MLFDFTETTDILWSLILVHVNVIWIWCICNQFDLFDDCSINVIMIRIQIWLSHNRRSIDIGDQSLYINPLVYSSFRETFWRYPCESARVLDVSKFNKNHLSGNIYNFRTIKCIFLNTRRQKNKVYAIWGVFFNHEGFVVLKYAPRILLFNSEFLTKQSVCIKITMSIIQIYLIWALIFLIIANYLLIKNYSW